jgi:hypothetical protein
MSNNSRSDNSWIPLAIGSVVAIIAYIIWQFSTFFGLDMSSGASVFGRLVVLLILIGVSWKFGDDFEPIRPGNIWPILLALLWLCCWPALDFWASKQVPSFFNSEEVSIWWDAWYTKWGVFAALIGLGYWIKKMMGD